MVMVVKMVMLVLKMMQSWVIIPILNFSTTLLLKPFFPNWEHKIPTPIPKTLDSVV